MFMTIDDEKLTDTLCTDGSVQIAGMTIPYRQSVPSFFVHLEYELFTPGTQKNDAFQIALVPFVETHWLVASIPHEALSRAKDIADEFGFSLKQSTPVKIELTDMSLPIMSSISIEKRKEFEKDKDITFVDFFPIQTDTLYSLEKPDEIQVLNGKSIANALSYKAEMSSIEQYVKEKESEND